MLAIYGFDLQDSSYHVVHV